MLKVDTNIFHALVLLRGVDIREEGDELMKKGGVDDDDDDNGSLAFPVPLRTQLAWSRQMHWPRCEFSPD